MTPGIALYMAFITVFASYGLAQLALKCWREWHEDSGLFDKMLAADHTRCPECHQLLPKHARSTQPLSRNMV